MPVFLNNVDDYLGPSQACVNPLFSAPSKPSSSDDPSPDADSASAKVHGSNKVAQLDAQDSSPDNALETKGEQPVGLNRRRIRRRQAPRVIKCEDNVQPSEETKSNGGPVRLVHDTIESDIASNPLPSQESTKSEFSSTSQTVKKKAKATVTLSDCLSCSGCVTSAEAVLMSHHSVDKLREVALSLKLNQPLQNLGGQSKRTIAFTISPASLADLYRHLYLEHGEETSSGGDADVPMENSNQTIHKIAPINRNNFLQKISFFLASEFGASMIIDGNVSQRISLMESASEFCYRFKQQQSQENKSNGGTRKSPTSTMTSVALSSTQTRFIDKKSSATNGYAGDDEVMEVTTLTHPPGRFIEGDDGNGEESAILGQKNSDPTQLLNSSMHSSLPMLASSCPGFVCLVEKTAPTVVPLLSSAKSSMAVAGTVLKAGFWDTIDSSDIFHVAIMPCHDKKLEAGRSDFAWERQALLTYGNAMKKVGGSGSSAFDDAKKDSDDIVNEVDLVLTTGELLEVLSEAASKSLGNIKSSDQPDDEVVPTSTMNRFLTSLAHDSGSDESPCLLVSESFDGCNTATLQSSSDSPNTTDLESGVHGSGSYADYIFRYAAWNLFGCELPLDDPLPWKSSTSAAAITAGGKASGVLRRRRRRQETTDMREVALYKQSDGSYSCTSDSDDASPVLRFATAYGFKNVQLILQSLSKDGGSSECSEQRAFDYVEIMACPSGCPNGGGQIGALGQRETPRETKERVKKTVSVMSIIRPKNEKESIAASVYERESAHAKADDLLPGSCFGKSARRLLHTRFHAVPKLELSTGATAGVAVSDTKW